MKLTKTTLVIAAGLIASAAQAAATMSFEEAYARNEEKLILTSPIAGIENNLWFDYLIDVTEAQKEVANDLRRASDLEDIRDAWEEYGEELREEREDYIEEMAERGYRSGTVIFN